MCTYQASQSPAHLIITGRNPSKLQQSIDALKAEFPDVDYRLLQIDLSSQASVRAGAAQALSWTDIPTINIIINSAGVALIPERTLSEDGIELTFATNHIGHFLLTSLLMPKVLLAAKTNPKGTTRIINVSSGSPHTAGMRWSDPNFETTNADLPPDEQPNYAFHAAWNMPDAQRLAYTPLEAYNQSKVANVLFGIALTRRLYAAHGVLSLAVHPGVIRTELARSASAEIVQGIQSMFETGVYTYKTLGAGSATSLVAALDPGLGPGEVREGGENWGAFLVDCQIVQPGHPRAARSDEAERLWALSERLVGEQFAW